MSGLFIVLANSLEVQVKPERGEDGTVQNRIRLYDRHTHSSLFAREDEGRALINYLSKELDYYPEKVKK